MRNPQIASLLFNVPLLVLPEKLDAIIYGLQERLGVFVESAPEPSMYLTAIGERREPGYRVIDGVAVIEIFGGLAHRGGMQADSTYILGYQTIAQRIDAALADVGVHTILLLIDSPGGEVSGVFDLANKIYKSRGLKRIVASVSDMACSASYLIAAACTEIVASVTSCAGSIGVVMRHVDQSKRIEDMGYVITNIFVGDHKVDGNCFEPLPKEVRARYEEICIKFYSMFTDRVSIYRDMALQAVVGTQAKVYVGDESLSVGLIDDIETPDETVSRLISEKGDAGSRRTVTGMETEKMSAAKEKPTAQPKASPAASATTSEPVKQEPTEEPVKAENNQPAAEAVAAAPGSVKAERDRIKQIMGCDAAVNNKVQAEHLAYETEMSADAAIAVLKAGVSATKPAENKLDAAMSKVVQPNIAAEGDAADAETAERSSLVSAIAGGIKKNTR